MKNDIGTAVMRASFFIATARTKNPAEKMVNTDFMFMLLFVFQKWIQYLNSFFDHSIFSIDTLLPNPQSFAAEGLSYLSGRANFLLKPGQE